jgi:hypothetical protein
MGDTPAQVTAFRVERAVLFGYVDAAHHQMVERVAARTPTQLGQPITPYTGERRPAWRSTRSRRFYCNADLPAEPMAPDSTTQGLNSAVQVFVKAPALDMLEPQQRPHDVLGFLDAQDVAGGKFVPVDASGTHTDAKPTAGQRFSQLEPAISPAHERDCAL